MPVHGGAMQAVSVINFKGGVGKTTLTANLGVDLARRGYKVMLLDLDPQCSLTFSFYSPADYQKHLRGNGTTIKNWLDGFLHGRPTTNLGKFFAHPTTLNQQIGAAGGYVHLIPSDLDLINVELRMFTAGSGSRGGGAELEVLNRRGALRDAIREFPIAAYDFVLMDCPPGMSLLTQSAIVAGDHLMIPTRPDYLSTVGIESLMQGLMDLRTDYNGQLAKHGLLAEKEFISPHLLGIVFTMVSLGATGPIGDHQYFIDRVKARFPRSEQTGADATFTAMVRASNKHFGNTSPADGFPVMSTWANNPSRDELRLLTDEFLTKFPGLRKAAAA
jgi:chromosome partitioning protein